MSFEQVKEFFLAAGAADRLLELPQSSATVELAAKAIGCPAGADRKNAVVSGGGRPVLIVAAATPESTTGNSALNFRKKRKCFLRSR